MSDVRAPIVLDRKGGIGLMVTDDQTRLRRTTVLREAVSALKRQSNLSEELRILYVAMTRAEEKLVLLLSCKNASKTLRSVSERFAGDFSGADDPIDPYQVLSARSYADWILAGALVHPSGGCCAPWPAGE